ncbi:MAG TPA: hypothetical protein VNE39_12680 [Planctomycetota bacterium]|nr:hypothetical protein [Planctomycetota bacterium]
MNSQPSERRRSASGSPEGWQAFEVGEDFIQDRELMKLLAERRSGGKRIPLEEVEAELGLR